LVFLDEEKGKLELEKNGLCVPHLLMVITALIKMLFNDMDEEDHEEMKGLLNDIVEDQEEELKNQFEAIRITRPKILINSLKGIVELVEDEDEERLN
jgi:hypothetical protein